MVSQNKDLRLIEVAFPLKQASLDSVHEKNVRHGHIAVQKSFFHRQDACATGSIGVPPVQVARTFLDSYISTLHIWPARRPLAACRAALIATLLPDPGNEEEHKKLLEKIAGKVVQTIKKKKLAGGRIEETIN